jgi:hypothetical protein
VDGPQSDSDNVLRRDGFWHMSSGGTIAGGRFQKFESGGRAMTVSAQLRFLVCETLAVRYDLSRHA